MPEMVRRILGEAGSIETLTLVREGEDAPLVTDVVRVNIDVPSVILSYEGENEDVAKAEQSNH